MKPSLFSKHNNVFKTVANNQLTADQKYRRLVL